jgi:hypothetical protein
MEEDLDILLNEIHDRVRVLKDYLQDKGGSIT